MGLFKKTAKKAEEAVKKAEKALEKAVDEAVEKAEAVAAEIKADAAEAIEKVKAAAEEADAEKEAPAEAPAEESAEEVSEEAPVEETAEDAPAEEITAEDSAEEAPAEESAQAEEEAPAEADYFENLHIIDHPLVQHKLTIMRDKNTGAKDFRQLLDEIAMLVGYEVTRDLPLCDIDVETPLVVTKGKALEGKKLAIVPILRAGLGMVDGMLRLVPAAKVGHIGLYRHPETHQPVEYYCKLPDDVGNRLVIVTDPMLATGGSASAAIDMLKEKGCNEIRLMCLVAAPEGIKAIHEAHPEVPIFTAALDERLNEKAYILPGLGDAGDRIFGTY